MSTSRRYTLSNIMNNAWMLVRRFGLTISQAMRKAWAVSKLKDAMRKGIVKFTYAKLDGSIRTAWGTLKESLLPPTAGSRKPNDTLVTYYDTDKQAYRCFKIANFIEMA